MISARFSAFTCLARAVVEIRSRCTICRSKSTTETFDHPSLWTGGRPGPGLLCRDSSRGRTDLVRFLATEEPFAEVYRSIVGSTNTAMTAKPSKTPRRIGRPPAGARAGEKVKDYPQLSIRLPAEVKARLQALSLIHARPQWRILTDAIDCYIRERPESERRIVREIAGRTRARAQRRRP